MLPCVIVIIGFIKYKLKAIPSLRRLKIYTFAQKKTIKIQKSHLSYVLLLSSSEKFKMDKIVIA